MHGRNRPINGAASASTGRGSSPSVQRKPSLGNLSSIGVNVGNHNGSGSVLNTAGSKGAAVSQQRWKPPTNPSAPKPKKVKRTQGDDLYPLVVDTILTVTFMFQLSMIHHDVYIML